MAQFDLNKNSTDSVNMPNKHNNCGLAIYSFIQIDRVYECTTCNKKFSIQNEIHKHMKQHLEKTSDYQSNAFENHSKQGTPLIGHEKLNTDGKLYQYNKSYSNQKFSKKICLIKQLYNHKIRKSNQHHISDNKFTTYRNLDKQKHIQKIGKFKCNVCEQKFMYKSSLNAHMGIHIIDKPYGCDVCEKKFMFNSCLIAHMGIHTVDKPFGCDVCKKKFMYNSSLIAHMGTHTVDKPFGCDVCKKKFMYNSSLIAHKHSHTLRQYMFNSDLSAH